MSIDGPFNVTQGYIFWSLIPPLGGTFEEKK